MTGTRGRRTAVVRRPHFSPGRAAATIAAAALFFASSSVASAAGPAGASLATYRGGAVSRAEFEGYQTRKLGAEGYRDLLKERGGLRAAVLRLALFEVVAGLAGEAGLRESAGFKERLRQHENEMLARLWRRKIQDEVTVDDAALERMIPEQAQSVFANWASFPGEEEAVRFAAALRAGSDFPAAARVAGLPDAMIGETRLSANGESHFSAASQTKILALAVGEVAGPLREPIGWYVVMGVERGDPAKERAAERERLRPDVLRSAREKALAAAAAALRAKAVISVDEKALADPGARARVAEVNGEAVVFAPQGMHGVPQHSEMEKLLRKQLDKQIDELLAAQEARRLGLEARDPQWAERIGDYTLDLLHELYRERVFQGFQVDEGEVLEYYERNPDLFKTKAMVRLRQIVLDSAYLAGRYRADLLAGRAEFEELARRVSIDRGSAETGGDQGWMPEDNIREESRRYVEALRPGEVSIPIEVSRNYYLIKLEARTEPQLIPYDQVRERARSRALLSKRTSSWQEFLDRKQKEERVTLDEAQIELLAAAAR